MNKELETLVIIHPHFTLPGGAGKVILELGKRLATNMNVVIICQKANEEYIKAYTEIKFESLDGPVTSSLRFWLLLPYWRKNTFKIIDKYRNNGKIKVLCNVFPANWIGLPYKKSHSNVKMFWYCHEPSAFIHVKKWRDSIKSPIKRFIIKLIYPLLAIYDKKITNLADEIFSNSDYTSDNIRKIYNSDSIIVYPGVDAKKFKPLPLYQKENYIMTVGRLTRFKNINLLLEGFANIKDKGLNLYIIGVGEEMENLKLLSENLCIDQQVKFLGNVSDVDLPEIYARAKAFVLCSKDEPFGIVPIEAMAAGTPVIADNSGGPKEIVKDGKTGLLIDCSPDNIAKAINNILNMDLAELSQKARADVIKRFSWKKSADLILNSIND